MSLRKKLLFSVVAVTAFFLLAEGILALIGIKPLTATEDPFVGFSGRVPLMVQTTNDRGGAILKTAPAKLVRFNEQQFPASKPRGTKRIFCVGGSTTFGRPFGDATSYCGWLRRLLPLVDGKTNWEVINAGGVSYASYRVARVMEELAQYEPDLFVVYSAHNEFLEHRTYANIIRQPAATVGVAAKLASTRTWSAISRLVRKTQPPAASDPLSAEVDEIMNHTIGPSSYHRDEKWKRDVLEHYRFNLVRMIQIAENAGASIVFITPAANEKNCSPFKSQHRDDLAPAEQEEFDKLFDRGVKLAAGGQHEAALGTWKLAAEIDDAYAQLHFEFGKSLLAMQRYKAAKQAFRRAINEDVCPLRAIDEIELAIQAVTSEYQIPVVDFSQQLWADCRANLGHDIPGREYFLDHVHPTVDTHQTLALCIVNALLEHRILTGSRPSDSDIQSVEQAIRSEIDPHASGVALRNLAKVLHWSGKFDEALPRARDALKLLPDDAESMFILADCLAQSGRIDQAIEQYDQLLKVNPLYLRAAIPFGELLVDQAQYARAKPLLQTAQLIYEPDDPKYLRATYFLGIAHCELGEFREAIPLLQQVHTQYPDEPRTLFFLAQSQAGVGDSQQAMESYHGAIALDSNDASFHHRLGLLLLKEQQHDKAAQHLQRALELDEENETIRQQLEIARQLSR